MNRAEDRSMPAWKAYQEDAASVFRDLGFRAVTDVTVEGARNQHDIDVLASYEHAGLELTWIIECKHWKSRVPKERVLTLRAIVEDVGADRGVMLAEGGFQSGAVQATRKSNVVVTSLADLRAEAAQALTQRRLLALPERIASAYARYWAIPKSYREGTGLRPDGPTPGYSGAGIIRLLQDLVVDALAGTLPPRGPLGPSIPVHTKGTAAGVAEFLLADLESRLSEVEDAMPHAMKRHVAEERRGREEYESSLLEDEVAIARSIARLLERPTEEIVSELGTA